MNDTVDDRAVVEVDLFSGRPNPRFVLDAEATRVLASLVQALPVGREHEIPDVGLGFRGFRVTLGPSVLLVRGPVVLDETSSATRHDKDRQVERWLSRWVRDHGDPRLARALPDPDPDINHRTS
ncbi:MAG TPA: hypothetical protein VI357_02270 [Mycobacteriales bacterium]